MMRQNRNQNQKNDSLRYSDELQYDSYGEDVVYEDGEYYDDYYDNEEYYDDDYYDDYDNYDNYPQKSPWRTVAYMLAVLLVSVAIATVMWFAADDVLALTKADNTVTVTISEGDTLEEIAANLQEHGLVNYKLLFILYGKFSNAESKISAGTYELNQQYEDHALINSLRSSSSSRTTVTLTFQEGYTCDQIFALLAENGVCELEDLEEVAANYEFDYEFLSDLSYGETNRLEGYLFPDTYEFYVGDDAARVINKFLNNFSSKVTDEMLAAIDDLNASIRERMVEEGTFTEEEIEDRMMDLHKILTVASLIEKEAGTDSERTNISSVIYNRLTTHVHQLLQIDATVEYAIGEHKTELTSSDLAVDSLYNTYKYTGLPPGPIANAGIASIMAAIYPADTDYFFYALNTSGSSHKFFATYMEQQAFLSGEETETIQEESEEDTEEDAPDEEVPLTEEDE